MLYRRVSTHVYCVRFREGDNAVTSGRSGVISRLRRSRLEFGGMSGSRWSEVSMDTQTIVTKRLDISMLEDSVGQHRRKIVVKEGWSIGRITRNRGG